MTTLNSFTVQGFQPRLALKPQKRRKVHYTCNFFYKIVIPVIQKDPYKVSTIFGQKRHSSQPQELKTTTWLQCKNYRQLHYTIPAICGIFLMQKKCVHGNEEAAVCLAWKQKEKEKRKFYSSKSLFIKATWLYSGKSPASKASRAWVSYTWKLSES